MDYADIVKHLEDCFATSPEYQRAKVKSFAMAQKKAKQIERRMKIKRQERERNARTTIYAMRKIQREASNR